MSEYDISHKQYQDEVKQRWGDTAAYKESQSKTAGYSKEKWAAVNDGLNDMLSEFAVCMSSGESADSGTAQQLVNKLQQYVTANFYHCTNEILAGLGQMYVCDERFKNNINKHGEGTAEFISEAIKIYCK
ncbi:MAG: TipAS antibiotic-recognition domain-containing protein [Clostridia bacterium]|nr:TipAS antibiotic-recognition domain-containing protein [Clostridia bacterium]